MLLCRTFHGSALLHPSQDPHSHCISISGPSAVCRRRQDHGEVVSEPEPAGGSRRGLQEGEADAVLRAGEPEGPRVAQDQRPAEEGQDVPVQDDRPALRRRRRLLRVRCGAQHPHGNLLRARLRAGLHRRRGRLRPDDRRQEGRQPIRGVWDQRPPRLPRHCGGLLLGLLRRRAGRLVLHGQEEDQEVTSGWTLAACVRSFCTTKVEVKPSPFCEPYSII